jgi:hypothetical protein
MFSITTANEYEEDDDIVDLALAKERRNGEFTNADDFLKFMDNTINNGIHCREESL